LSALEPVYLELEPARITEYGKHWLERRFLEWERFGAILHDVAKLAEAERWRWPHILRTLELEGVPQNVSQGITQSQMQALVNASTKQATYTAPAAFFTALLRAAPTSTDTGATVTEANYTGYARQSTTMGAASAATPTNATNTAQLNFPACSAGTSTLLGFVCIDSVTIGAGTCIWFGTLASTVISTTATPPVVPASSLILSLTGT
jgi:hypothetical protein